MPTLAWLIVSFMYFIIFAILRPIHSFHSIILFLKNICLKKISCLFCVFAFFVAVEKEELFSAEGRNRSESVAIQFHVESCHICYFYYEPSLALQHMNQATELAHLSISLSSMFILCCLKYYFK